MSKSSHWLRSFTGGIIALSGASLVSWQGVLMYYLITGRVQAGAEYPPVSLTAVFLILGILLTIAGYRISNPRGSKSKTDERR